jgi:TonB family protein
MKSLTAWVATAGLAWLAAPVAQASNVKLIANDSVKSEAISTGEVKKIFLLEKNSTQDGSHVEPVLEKGGRAHEAFLKEFLDMSDDTLQGYYRTLVFTGKGSMPKALKSDAEVVAYVARTRGAIGYVGADMATEGVRTLTIVESGGGERKLLTRVEPQYPETLKQLNIGGTVRFEVTISAKGTVEKIELLGGNPILAEAAEAAVKQWVYAAGHGTTTTKVSIPFETEH